MFAIITCIWIWILYDENTWNQNVGNNYGPEEKILIWMRFWDIFNISHSWSGMSYFIHYMCVYVCSYILNRN